MNIGCAKKLLDELKLRPGEMVDENTLFSWHANLITINRRKAVILVNDRTRYCVLLFGLKTSNFKNIGDIITNAIAGTFLAEGISAEIVNNYIETAGTITFTKTYDRSVVAIMNQFAQVAEDYQNEELDMDNINQIDFNLRTSGWLCKVDRDYKHPKEMLLEAIQKFTQGDNSIKAKPVVSVRAFQFLITLDLERHKVWRRVIVPADITFRKLHFAIQAAFGWQNYHLHEFIIFKNKKPVALIASNEEALDSTGDLDYPIMMDGNTNRNLKPVIQKLFQHIPYLFPQCLSQISHKLFLLFP